MITRRHFIAGGLGALAGSGFLYFLGTSTTLKNTVLSDGLEVSPNCIHPGIGIAYLEKTSPQPTARSLKYTLDMRFGDRSYCHGQKLREHLQRELENGQTAEVQGWVLPESLVLLSAYGVLQGAN